MVKKLQYILLKITTNNFNLKKYNPIQIIINYKKIQNLKKILAYKKIQNLKKILAPIKERA